MKESAPHPRLLPSSPPSWFSLFFSLQVVWFALILSVWVVFLLRAPFDADYASGEMLDHVLSWRETGRLYPSIESPPYRVLNYPPLFFLFTRSFSFLGMSMLTTGRLLTLLAMGVSFYLLFQWLKKSGCRTWGSLCIISLSALNIPLLFFGGQLHLQWMAVAFSFGGLFLLQDPKNDWTAFFSGTLCALACLTKQTQVVSAFIAMAWLARYHRRSLLFFSIGFLLTGGLGSWLIHRAFGEQVWRHLITYTVGTFSWGELAHQFFENVFPWFFLVLAAFFQALRNKESLKDLRWWYFLGTSVALFTSARHGASYQYFIEWSLVTLLWLGPWLWQWLQKDFRLGNRVQALLALLLIVQVIGADLNTGAFLNRRGHELKSDQDAMPGICRELPPSESLILAEEAGLVRACGRRPVLHPFIMTNLAHRGLWREKPLLDQISSKTYSVVLLPFDPSTEKIDPQNGRWTLKMIQILNENYQVKKQHGRWRILTPNPPSSIRQPRTPEA